MSIPTAALVPVVEERTPSLPPSYHLGSIKIENFKSYSGTFEIGPFPFCEERNTSSMVCVVGPNGSGKSNLMDAVAFCFACADSTKLRGNGNLANLVSADCAEGGSASVEVVLVRDDGGSIAFSRSVGGGPTSKYRINGRIVSLESYRDRMRECGMDTGGNFLVFQGDVEQLALASPEELGRAVDRVSGSAENAVEYEELRRKKGELEVELSGLIGRRKKIAADKKRVETELGEFEKIKRLKNSLNEARTKQVMGQLFKLNKEWSECVGDVDIDMESVSEESIEVLESRLQETKSRRAKADMGRAKLERKIFKTSGLLSDQTSSVEQLRSAIAFAEKKKEMAERELEGETVAKEKLIELTKKLAESVSQQRQILVLEEEQLQSVLSAGLGGVIDFNLESDRDVLYPYFESKGSSFERFRRSLTDLRCGSVAQAVAPEQDTVEKLNSEIKYREQRILGEAEKSGEIENQLRRNLHSEEQLKAELDQATQTLEQMTIDLRRLQQEGEILANKRAKIDTKLSSDLLVQKQALIEEMAAAEESEESVSRERALMDAVTFLKGTVGNEKIFGRVIDLVTPAEPKFAVALQTALGKYIDAVMVDTVGTARECLAVLKRGGPSAGPSFGPSGSSFPSITFIPVADVVVPTAVVHSDCPGAMDCVLVGGHQSPEAVLRGVSFLLNETLVCETLKQARLIGYSKKVRVVTLGGEVVYGKSGNITVGFGNVAKVGRFEAKKTADLAKKLDDMEQRIEVTMKDIKEMDVRVGENNMALRAVEISNAQAKLQVDKLKMQYVRVGDAVAVGRRCLTEMEVEKQRVLVEVEQMRKQREEIVDRIVDRAVEVCSEWVREQGLVDRKTESAGAFKKLLRRSSSSGAQTTTTSPPRDILEALIGVENDPRKGDTKQLISEKRRMQKARVLELERKLRDLETEHRLVVDQLGDMQKRIGDMMHAKVGDAKNLKKLMSQLATAESARGILETELEEARTGLATAVSDRTACDTEISELLDSISKNKKEMEIRKKKQLEVTNKRMAVQQAQVEIVKRAVLDNVYVPLLLEDSDFGSGFGGARNDAKELSQQILDAFVMASMAVVTAPTDHSLTEEVLSKIDYSSCLKTTDLRHMDSLEKSLCTTITQLEQEIEQMKFVRSAGADIGIPLEIRLNTIDTELAELTAHIDSLKTELSTSLNRFKDLKLIRNKKFIQCFQFVATKVNQLYQVLAGGTCAASLDLEVPLLNNATTITTTTEYFSTGVIFALMPPNKRYTNVELLSGGEKTVAAVALLFSLLSYNSPPFAMVDEIDAALDSGNVNGLAKFMKTAGPKQLLVISLNPKMYTKADGLIGVFKEGGNAKSGLISIDLREYPIIEEEELVAAPEYASPRCDRVRSAPLAVHSVDKGNSIDEVFSDICEGPQMTPAPIPRRAVSSGIYRGA